MKIRYGVKCKRPALLSEARELGVLPDHTVWVKLDGRYDVEQEAIAQARKSSEVYPDYLYQVFSEVTIEKPVLIAFKGGEQIL